MESSGGIELQSASTSPALAHRLPAAESSPNDEPQPVNAALETSHESIAFPPSRSLSFFARGLRRDEAWYRNVRRNTPYAALIYALLGGSVLILLYFADTGVIGSGAGVAASCFFFTRSLKLVWLIIEMQNIEMGIKRGDIERTPSKLRKLADRTTADYWANIAMKAQ